MERNVDIRNNLYHKKRKKWKSVCSIFINGLYNFPNLDITVIRGFKFSRLCEIRNGKNVQYYAEDMGLDHFLKIENDF